MASGALLRRDTSELANREISTLIIPNAKTSSIFYESCGRRYLYYLSRMFLLLPLRLLKASSTMMLLRRLQSVYSTLVQA